MGNGSFGGVSLQGCPAEAWPVDVVLWTNLLYSSRPRRMGNPRTVLSGQPANCPTTTDPNNKCPYVEALDITPPGTVTPNNVVISTHPGTVIEARVDSYGANYVHVQDNCGGNFRDCLCPYVSLIRSEKGSR